MHTTTVVDLQFDAIVAMDRHLSEAEQPTLLVSANDWLRKILLMSVASYFEHRITTILVNYVGEKSNRDEGLTYLFRTQVIERRYHQLFSWDGNNANGFFRLFGDTLSQQMKEDVRKDSALNESIRAFLQLGELRNNLVHDNFASYALSLSYREIYSKYQDADRFMSYLEEKLC